MPIQARWPLLFSVLVAVTAGCRDDEPAQRLPPPPPPKPATCSATPQVNDPANVKDLPAQTGSYCLDPMGSDKGYGEGAKNPIDGICDMFDGECEIYKRFNVRRVVEVRYVDGGGTTSSIDVYVSRFDTSSGAYGMFTKRVVGDGDPAHPDTPRPIAGGGAAALGIGNAYLWRGNYLAELTFNDDQATAEQIKAKADAVLPALVKELGDKLTGDAALPAAAAALPADNRLPLGVRYVTDDVLDVEGVGEAALGYYRDGDRRWRVLSMVRADKAQAKDALVTLGGKAGKEVKALGDGAVRTMLAPPGGAEAEWVIARKGNRVFGVGDESRVLRQGMASEELRKVNLSTDEKRARVETLLGAEAGKDG